MAKRSSSYLRTENEIIRDRQRQYAEMEKGTDNINPIFLQKPYSACKSILKGDKDKGKESISEGVKCRKKAQKERKEGK